MRKIIIYLSCLFSLVNCLSAQEVLVDFTTKSDSLRIVFDIMIVNTKQETIYIDGSDWIFGVSAHYPNNSAAQTRYNTIFIFKTEEGDPYQHGFKDFPNLHVDLVYNYRHIVMPTLVPIPSGDTFNIRAVKVYDSTMKIDNSEYSAEVNFSYLTSDMFHDLFDILTSYGDKAYLKKMDNYKIALYETKFEAVRPTVTIDLDEVKKQFTKHKHNCRGSKDEIKLPKYFQKVLWLGFQERVVKTEKIELNILR